MENQTSKCLVCEESCPQKGLTFFKFPKDESRLKVWMKEISPVLNNLKISPTKIREDGKICARHFKDTDFINFKKNSLVQNACPSIDIQETDKGLLEDTNFNCKNINANLSFQRNESVFDGQECDTFQCGRCKTQFQLLSEFIDHKRVQCKLTENKDLLDKIGLENSVLPLQKTFLLSFNNKASDLSQTDLETAPIEEGNFVKIIRDESQVENEVVSLVLNEKGLLISNTIPTFAGQVVITPKLQTQPILLSNSDSSEPVASVILTADNTNPEGELIFTCPIQSELPSSCTVLPDVIPNEEQISHVVLTQPEAKSLDNFLVDTSNCYYKLNNSVDEPQTEDLLSLIQEQLPEDSKSERPTEPEAPEKKELVKSKSKLSCSYCGKTFEKPFNLQQHERVHTGERPFQCIICGRAFSQKSNVRKHMMRHKVWPQAKQTLKITGDKSQQSVSQSFLDQMNYSCQYCTMSFKSYSLYKKHLTLHSNFKVYRCIQKGCDETFSDLDEFLSHSKVHSSAEFQCHICLKAFTSLGELGAHQYDHDMTGKDKKEIEVKLKCEVCSAQFKTVESLKNHMAVDTHNYECVHCVSVFSSERFLRRHIATHLDPSQSKYKCPNCKKTFRTQKYLNNHIFVHLSEKPFSCEHCNKQFASKYRLKRHLAIHLNQHFECPFKAYLGCHKTFYRKDKLRDHLTTHSNCRVRPCQLCSKTFSSVAKLNQHMKKEHKLVKGKNVLKCMNCSQTFRKQKQLTQHHCTVGERKFRSNVRHRTTEKTKTSETVSNIEIIMVPYVSDSANRKCVENLA
ncbi:hypothetical protein RUM43_009420 [Polyplax serrata]|uniref:Uncharacterized protein n=1 Tax=Polyplax serrata TaxID=468196 RepID=A0AAN8S257_POLSC